jgi:hypothetical protein
MSNSASFDLFHCPRSGSVRMAEAEVETPSDLNGVAVEIAKGDEVRTEIGLIRADQFRFQARMRWA